MTGGYRDRWHDPAEPSWVVEPTTEWQPQFPGQRYPGDIGTRHVPAPPPRGRAAVVGRAEVPPLAPTRPDGTYLGRSWDEHDEEPPRWGGHPVAEQQPHADEAHRRDDDLYRRPASDLTWQRERRRPEPEAPAPRAARTAWADRHPEVADRPREGADRPREGADRPREGADRPREGADRP
ncbi:hypothetical protein M2302_006475, partial [Micromonospora sp. A200]|nr:hypothetical protein [Micromonospora sp. A200]